MEKTRRIMQFCMIACILFLSFSFDIYSETNIVWELNDGVLIISGTGKMKDYSENDRAPWYEHKDEVIEVTINEGITSIGASSFYECNNLQKVSLPDGLTVIRDFAFLDCSKLESINFPESLKTIADASFKGCRSLENITFYEGLQYIGHEAFFRCMALKNMDIPSSVEYLGKGVFSYCSSLESVSVNAKIEQLPSWTFYGCSSLVEINLSDSINDVGESAFVNCVNLDCSNIIDETLSGKITEQVNLSTLINTEKANDDNIVYKYNEETEDSVVNVTITEDSSKIDATVSSKEGLQEVLEKASDLKGGLENLNHENALEVNVTVDSPTKLDKKTLENLKDKDIILTLKCDEAEFIFDFTEVRPEAMSDVEVGYRIRTVDSSNLKVKEAIGEAKGYHLEFFGSSEINVKVKIYLGEENIHHTGTLYQLNGGVWEYIQTSLIDDLGFLTFYLSSYDSFTDYLIGIDVEDVSKNEAIIPDSISADYGNLTDVNGNYYKITGVKSRWGITLGQFSLIVSIVLIGTVLLIGAIMFVAFRIKQNKERVRYEVMNENKKNRITKSQ